MAKDIFLYTYVKDKDLDSIMSNGLASSVRISKDKNLLEKIFDNKKERDDFIKRTDSSDITQAGPSVFFSKPLSIRKIKDLDPKHPLTKEDYVLIKINYSKLKSDDPNVYIYGLELVPYEDEEYDDIKSDIEKRMTDDDLDKYIKMNSEDAWANYKSIPGFFAANVPHGVLINKDGLIDPKYLELSRMSKISKLYKSIYK